MKDPAFMTECPIHAFLAGVELPFVLPSSDRSVRVDDECCNLRTLIGHTFGP
jgi:hypothetical protein